MRGSRGIPELSGYLSKMLEELVEKRLDSTISKQYRGQYCDKSHNILRLARCFGAFFNKFRIDPND
jgi:hypothetical protein